MDERIKELALQANPASKEIYESDNWEYNCAAWCAQDVEKFAKLIVKDVLAQVDEFSRLTKAHKEQGIDPEIDVTKEVLKNFGVEK